MEHQAPNQQTAPTSNSEIRIPFAHELVGRFIGVQGRNINLIKHKFQDLYISVDAEAANVTHLDAFVVIAPKQGFTVPLQRLKLAEREVLDHIAEISQRRATTVQQKQTVEQRANVKPRKIVETPAPGSIAATARTPINVEKRKQSEFEPEREEKRREARDRDVLIRSAARSSGRSATSMMNSLEYL